LLEKFKKTLKKRGVTLKIYYTRNLL